MWEKCRVGKDMGLEREVGNYREIELCGKHGIAWRRRKTGKARDNWKDVCIHAKTEKTNHNAFSTLNIIPVASEVRLDD